MESLIYNKVDTYLCPSNIMINNHICQLIPIQMRVLVTVAVFVLSLATQTSPNLIQLQYKSGSYVTIFQNNVPNEQFISTANVWTCTPQQLFTYNQTSSQYENNTGYNLHISGFNSQLTINITSKYKLFIPTVNSSLCQPDTDCTILIQNNCPKVNYFYYFDIVEIVIPQLSLYSTQITQTTPLSYNVICDDSKPRNSFTWGQMILIVSVTLIITITAFFSKAWSWNNIGFEIKYISASIISILLALGFGFMISGVTVLIDIVKYSVIFLSFTVGPFSVMFVTAQLLYLLPSFGLHKGINVKIFKIRIMDMIGMVIGVGLIIAWWVLDGNFLISDIIAICILVSLIKLVKFTSLKVPLYLFVCTTCVLIIFIVIVQSIYSTDYEAKLQDFLLSPFLFTLPNITPVPNRQCSSLYMLSLAFPGILLSYIVRFDHSRSSNVYSITFVICFVILAILWSLLNVVSPFTIPFDLMTVPVGFAFIVLFSNRRNELLILWEGLFQDEEYKDNKNHIAELIEVVKNEKTPSQLTFKKSLLKGLHFRDSSSNRSNYTGSIYDRKESSLKGQPNYRGNS